MLKAAARSVWPRVSVGLGLGLSTGRGCGRAAGDRRVAVHGICGRRCARHTVCWDSTVLDGDEVLRGLVLARIIEPSSKVDALRVLTETGVSPAISDSEASAACVCQTGCAPSTIVGVRGAR